MNRMLKYLFTAGIGIIAFLPAFGQDAVSTPPANDMQTQLLWFLIFALLVLSFTILTMTFTIMALIRRNRAQETAADSVMETVEGTVIAVERKPSPFSWKAIQQKLTDAVPISREAEIDLGHNYDGIRELDNNLPPWWTYGFYFTIAFAVVYLAYYHLSGSGWSSQKEYETEVTEATIIKEQYLQKVANLVNESNVAVLEDAASQENGKKIYMTNCIACHGALGQGGVGPNLTDAYWIHGGGISNIFKTIKYGVPEKGMIAWQDQLKPKEMQEVASFILTFQGTNPPDGKEPQGELYKPEETPPTPQQPTDSTSVVMIE
ncbi:MAG: cbb3-type cytochrome c oxidase N-terminal domain-containing protein [Bacteroidia bacterium]|nr:cbb3-type cytochrome c oxidase N-terminal domain-containing protein [Bacteroidia bacterium]